MRLFENAHYDFIGARKRAYVISAAVIALGILMALVWQVTRGSWLNYGVDFTGGTVVQVEFTDPTSVAELREVLGPVAPGSEITRFGEENEFLIRAPEFSEAGANVSDVIDRTLAEKYGADGFDVVRTEAVGPKVGAELQQKAIIAILLSFALTLVYLAFRFEWRFGVAAVIATFHDILITIGFIAAFRLDFSLPTVAAILTIVGYSLNDTIIVFDRVRENLGRSGRREDSKDLLNRSINETLPRTVMTSTTTLATLLALFLLGGPIIADFALILIFGILIGTYSSIFVATPALLEIEKRYGSAPTARGGKAPRAQRPAGAASA